MNYPGIRIEGAILSPDILERLEDAAGQQAADFGFDRSARVKDEIARAWADAQDYWRIPVADGGDFRRGDDFFCHEDDYSDLGRSLGLGLSVR